MNRLITAGCFAIALGVWLAGPAVPAGLLQPPASGLPPLDYSLGPDSQLQLIPRVSRNHCFERTGRADSGLGA